MHIGVKIGAAALGAVGLVGALAACTGRKDGNDHPGNAPMGEFALTLMDRLNPGASEAKRPALDVQKDAVYREPNGRGGVKGIYDGTRLLTAADEHAYGTPASADATWDVKGDGRATFEEIRHVAKHFDVNSNDVLDYREAGEFESAVGIRWVAG